LSRRLKVDEKVVLGVVDYDTDETRLVSNTCNISAPPSSSLDRGVFVKMGSESEFFLAQIVDGPFFTKASSSSTLEARYVAELLTKVEKQIQRAVLTRPVPGTSVEPIEDAAVQKFLGISGGMYVGGITTNKTLRVMMDAALLSRHIGVFGTTGSGKSNTIQVLMEEATKEDFSVLVFDVEGEYVEMNKPTDMLHELLGDFGMKPAGVKDLKVYVPHPAISSSAEAIKFGFKFKDLDLNVFSEVAGLNRMEYLYFQDVIERITSVLPSSKDITLEAVIDRLMKRLKSQADNPTMPPFIAEAHTTLYSKLDIAQGLNVVDVKSPSIKMSEVFKAGRISVVDFSDATDPVRNIVISDILHKAFKYRMRHPESPKILFVIEEAHAFISKEKRDRMLATLMLMIETARRGRKRGVCLGIVTQQPTHLPSEVLELCNTRVMHRMSSTANIDSLRESTGNVPDGFWTLIPSLGMGEAVYSTPRYTRALTVTMRPVYSKRIATE
jgi:DNA helicase HerA-like ATPase